MGGAVSRRVTSASEPISAVTSVTNPVGIKDSGGVTIDPLSEADFVAKADIAASALRDAIVGSGPKTLTDLNTALAALKGAGAVYVKSNTATGDAARRFETTAKFLQDVVIAVVTNDQLFGDSSGQTYPVGAGETIGFTKVDISTLYFKNATAGQNGTVHILGVE